MRRAVRNNWSVLQVRRKSVHSPCRKALRIGCSCEHPMHIPAGIHCFAVVKTMAEYPEAATMRIFHAIIIARQPFFPAPPFMRNPLRPLKTAHLMKGTPPAEAMRRSVRSEEHTSELQSLMRISYAVFCLKKKTK